MAQCKRCVLFLVIPHPWCPIIHWPIIFIKKLGCMDHFELKFKRLISLDHLQISFLSICYHFFLKVWKSKYLLEISLLIPRLWCPRIHILGISTINLNVWNLFMTSFFGPFSVMFCFVNCLNILWIFLRGLKMSFCFLNISSNPAPLVAQKIWTNHFVHKYLVFFGDFWSQNFYDKLK